MAPAGSGAPQGDRSQGVNGYVLNTITPETATSCHYFWAFARNYSLHEQRLTHELREGVSSIFREDETVLEAQQRAIDEHPDHRFYNLNIDAGAMWARRLIDRMIEREPEAQRVIPLRRGLRVAGEFNEASQTVKAQLRLRELIVGGDLVPGERVPELALVERLGVSRTPVRTALQRLQDEGLLDALPGGGYAVKAFSEAEIRDAIEVRGTMEGLAARLAAERGITRSMLAQAREVLAGIDALLAVPLLDEAAFAGYVEHNARFHGLLAEMAGSDVVRRQVERAAAQPFASPNGFVLVRSSGPAGARRARRGAGAAPRGARGDREPRGRACRKPGPRTRTDRPSQPQRSPAQPAGDAAAAGCRADPPRPLSTRARR